MRCVMGGGEDSVRAGLPASPFFRPKASILVSPCPSDIDAALCAGTQSAPPPSGAFTKINGVVRKISLQIAEAMVV